MEEALSPRASSRIRSSRQQRIWIKVGGLKGRAGRGWRGDWGEKGRSSRGQSAWNRLGCRVGRQAGSWRCSAYLDE